MHRARSFLTAEKLTTAPSIVTVSRVTYVPRVTSIPPEPVYIAWMVIHIVPVRMYYCDLYDHRPIHKLYLQDVKQNISSHNSQVIQLYSYKKCKQATNTILTDIQK